MRINKLLFTLTSLGLFSGSLGIVNSTTSCKNTNEEEKNLMVANINEESWLMYTNYNVSPTIVPNINIYARLKSGSKWELLKNNTIYRFFAGQTVYFKGDNPGGLNLLTEGYKF